jgi:alkanesulfonate monooxygenase SsuD/methylene tetrahydromethanopterin reductase-like flavin-dependent oxidoreductase (luciferase family)
LHDAAPNPQPVGPLPIWVAVGGTLDHAKRLIDLYRTAGRDAGHSDQQLTVGITSHFYVGETQEQALDDFYPHYHRYLSPQTNGGRGWHVDRPAMAGLAARRGALMVGGPTQVAEKILDLHAELGVDRFLGQVDLGGMPQPMVRDSIHRFGDVVAPAVRHVLTREQERQPA